MLHSDMMSLLLLLKITAYFAQEQAMKPKGSKRRNSLHRNKATKCNATKPVNFFDATFLGFLHLSISSADNYSVPNTGTSK